IRDENSTLRKIDAELQSEIKELNNLYKKTRLELDRCIHEKWAESRRYEREKTAIQSENALLRARLVSNAPPMQRSDDEKNQPLSSPETGRQPTAAINPGDISNNSSEAELTGIARASPIFPLVESKNVSHKKTAQLPTMPSYPPPPPMGMMSYGPPPPLSGYMSAGGGSSSFYGPFEDYRRASPAQSPRDFHYSSRHDIRGGQPRRNKSKARSNPSRSPSPTYASSGPRRETSDYGLGNNASKNRRARSRGGASNRDRREESQSPPPPTSSRRRHDARRGLNNDDEDGYQASSSQQQYNSRYSTSLYK
uniref:Uncharacterized protein n=1 Tax=Romanomermis culicivorax TaxID=13658 RepID=A0A915IEX9_ROMCU